ncbi:MAG: class I SAM-dependent methyltransferase [Planctomycetes bacterium]|nr:class I SAM-dependent methyltransferase [Planctomycetota bacterium]
MTSSAALLLSSLCLLPQAPTVAPADPEATAAGRATYLGREVAHTMHWTGAGWLMRATREHEENGALLRRWLAVRPGQAVCDLGCGNGYHTLPLAEAVGTTGTVFAVDLQPQMLKLLAQRVDAAGLDNVRYVPATVDDPKLAAGSCDLVLMVDVYHELSHPVRVMRHVRRALKQDGQVVLVEFRSEDPDVPIKPEHMMSHAQVVREMASHGFALARATDELPWQHALAFTPAAEPDGPFEARQLLAGFAVALRGNDRRLVAPYLTAKLAGRLDGRLDGDVELPPDFVPPADGATAELVAIDDDAMRARWPGWELRLQRDAAGRWSVADIAKVHHIEPVIRELHGFRVLVDPALLDGPHQPAGSAALSMLANHLERIAILVPEEPLARLRTLPIWIEREHPELANMQYHPSRGWLEHHGYDPRLARKVHIPRARDLLSRAQLLKHPAVVLHELAHAYHDQVLGFDDARVVAAFRAARASRVYEDVLAHTGRRVRHYALTNHKEYFAEATEAHLYRNDFFPFVRAELAEVDPKGHALMREIWGEAR